MKVGDWAQIFNDNEEPPVPDGMIGEVIELSGLTPKIRFPFIHEFSDVEISEWPVNPNCCKIVNKEDILQNIHSMSDEYKFGHLTAWDMINIDLPDGYSWVEE